MRYLTAVIQYEPRFGEKAYNLERLAALTREAAGQGARLAILPEMAATGYVFRDRAEIAPLAEPVPAGPTTSTLAALAAELGLHIACGLPEVEPTTGAFYNSAVLVGPQGYIGRYRKTHLYTDDIRWAREGDVGIPVFATPLGRIALQICMDLIYFEPCRVAALAGADVVAACSNWVSARAPWWARAVENGVYLACANRWGEERGTRFAGGSAVFGPDGALLGEAAAGDGIALAEVDTAKAASARAAALAVRRPELYQDLLLSTHLWGSAGTGRSATRDALVAVGQASGLAGMVAQAEAAALQGAELVILPLQAEPVPAEPLAAVAQAHGRHIVWGAPEEPGYQTAWLVGPKGLTGRYRQVHVPPGAGQGALPGDMGFPLFDLPWGRLGLLLGPDLRVPEAARLLAKRGADLIAVPACWEEAEQRWLWASRWSENAVAVAVANRAGGSRVWHMAKPRPEAGPGAEELLLCRVDLTSEQARGKDVLRMLRPRWYDPLVQPHPDIKTEA